MNREIGELHSTLQSPGWLETILPAIKQRLSAMEAAQDDPDLARQHRLPDDYIRGEKAVLKWLSTYFNERVHYTDEEDETEALVKMQQNVYDARAKLGYSYPGGTTPPINQPVE